jgi:hypothetical protein
MNRTLTALLSIALAFGTLSIGAGPAYASRGEPDYRVTTVAAVTGIKVASDTVWRCADKNCVATAATSRPEIVCARVARDIGKVESFSYRGSAFDADSLAKCNVKAR